MYLLILYQKYFNIQNLILIIFIPPYYFLDIDLWLTWQLDIAKSIDKVSWHTRLDDK